MSFDISKLTPEQKDRMETRIDEIQKLYNVSEAEFMIVIQLATLVRVFGLSPELSNKCLRCLSAINEMLYEEMK